MKLVPNTGNDRVIDLISTELATSQSLDIVTPQVSIFGFAALREALARIASTRMIFPRASDLMLLGDEADRASRNRLQARWLAKQCEAWLRDCVDLRPTVASVPQGTGVMRDQQGKPQRVVHGAFSLTTAGLGITPGNPLGLIQASETEDEAQLLSTWFETQWASLVYRSGDKQHVLTALQSLAADETAASRRTALAECERLEAQMARLRAAAAKERQVARQVELNLEIMRVQAEHSAAQAKL